MPEAATHGRTVTPARVRQPQAWEFAGRYERGPLLSELRARGPFRRDRLRALREGAGLSRTQLGFRVGMEGHTVGRYETGELTPAALTVLVLAYALDVSPASFYAEIPAPPLPT